MIDMLQNAKDLLAKGKTLNDPELIQMGMDLLEQYSEVPEPPPVEDVYECSHCNFRMSVDKPNRKRCPECKKHKLQLITAADQVYEEKEEDASKILEYMEQQNKLAMPQGDDFHMQVRDANAQRVHYDDAGNPDGMIRRREEVDPNKIKNEWEDDKTDDVDDPINEILKKYTKHTPRTRNSVKMLDVKCDRCGRQERLHPIHVRGRSRYVCARCVSKGSPT